MNIALIVILTIVSLFSVLFLVRRYRAATPAQRPQILVAACGAVAVAAALLLLFIFR